MTKMKLQPRYFEYMKNGSKRIELRLYDEKRSKIKIGDKITFLKEPDLNESIVAEVINLHRFNSFLELFSNFDIDILADKEMTKKELLEELEVFYTKDKQKEYGVLGIEVKII